MNARLLICIPCHNRKRIVEQCLPTVRDSIDPCDCLNLYDDGSTEFSPDWLRQFSPDVNTGNWQFGERPTPRGSHIGIEAQRRRHFMVFDAMAPDFTHLYLTDSDALHDQNWRSELLRLQEKYGGAPICGYNTEAHARIAGNTIEDDPASEVIWRRAAPGISYLLTAEHVAKVVAALPSLPAHWNWDWTVPAILGNRFAVTRVGLVDHIGFGGYHHPADEGYDGGDRVKSPTDWLIAKRAEVVKALEAKK